MILSKNAAAKKLRRMAIEIVERNETMQPIIIIGIKENGMVIAEEISKQLKSVFTGVVQTISLAIDKKNPKKITLSDNISLKDKLILLVDDVANSGRTMLYALAPLLAHNPSQIETLALVERTHKLFPVALNYVGLSVSTNADEHIEVIVENGKIMGAKIKS